MERSVTSGSSGADRSQKCIIITAGLIRKTVTMTNRKFGFMKAPR